MATESPIDEIMNRYLTQKEAASYLKVAKSTISMMTSRGEISHYRIGRSVRYRLDDLDKFMLSRKIAGKYEELGRKAR
ncbi:MAG: helix-turn-helix domain-containing protein [Desulfobacteraceae bacterium]|jgi:excisionase family DNA binding protein|nr:helix-turn-helix domain-containing protein [Desulfobacteraceae bacterium]